MRHTTAVIELAQAAGLALLPPPGPTAQTAKAATTFGVGKMMAAALDAGAQTLVLGLGGSASTDGGAGLLQALGASFADTAGQVLRPGAAHPLAIAQANLFGLDPRLRSVEVVIATDVDNPLYGPRGAAAIFAAQKGASAAGRQALDEALRRWGDVLTAAGARVRPEAAGAGAAGGVGVAAMSVLGANVRPGIQVVLELVRFDALLADAVLVITGEGSLDEQSLGGKAPMGVLRAAQGRDVPTIVVAGRCTLDADALTASGFHAVYSLADRAQDLETSIREAPLLLRAVGREIAVARPQDR
jgi:glycerate kinase